MNFVARTSLSDAILGHLRYSFFQLRAACNKAEECNGPFFDLGRHNDRNPELTALFDGSASA
jgi:hypothetical protein